MNTHRDDCGIVTGAPSPHDVGALLHLLIVSSDPLDTGYGGTTALHVFVDAVLRYSTWRLTLVAAATSRFPAFDPSRVRIVPVYSGRPTRGIAAALSYAASALGRASIAARDADIVIAWQPLLAGPIAWMSARLAGAPLIVRTSGPELSPAWSPRPTATRILKPLTRALLAAADVVVVKSEIERRLVSELGGTKSLQTIVNAVDGRHFAPPATAVRGPTVRLLAACQLELHKRVDRLMDGFARSRQQHDELELTIAGDGRERARLVAAAREIPGVRFVGALPHSAMASLYRSHHALVSASSLEGCSNAVLEALASGLPVIGGEGAIGELVNDGMTGIIARSCDADGLHAAIERFLVLHGGGRLKPDPGFVRQRYAPGVIWQSYASVFRALLDHGVGAA